MVSAGTAHPTQAEREDITQDTSSDLSMRITHTVDTGKVGWYVQSAQDVRGSKVVYVHIESLTMGSCRAEECL